MKLPIAERDTSLGRYHAPESTQSDSLPSLVMIHDVWGPSEHSHDLAADLAGEGFGVLEIDLYRDMGTVSIEEPGAFIRSLSDPSVLADLDRGADWLASETNANEKMGVIGVCMGGTYALLAACLSKRFSASAPFYGILSYDAGLLLNPDGRDLERKPLSPLEAADQLRMPLLASFGEEDEFVPTADVRDFESRLAKCRHSHQVDVYRGTGHAFLNRTREPAYRPEASEQAWSKVIPFFKKELS